jgi:hypothetical protein
MRHPPRGLSRSCRRPAPGDPASKCLSKKSESASRSPTTAVARDLTTKIPYCKTYKKNATKLWLSFELETLVDYCRRPHSPSLERCLASSQTSVSIDVTRRARLGGPKMTARLRRPSASAAPMFRRRCNFVRQARRPAEAIRTRDLNSRGMAACGAKRTFDKTSRSAQCHIQKSKYPPACLCIRVR